MLKQFCGLAGKALVAGLTMFSAPTFAMQCPTYDLVPLDEAMFNLPGQLAKWKANAPFENELVFDLEAHGAMPRLFRGYLVLAIYKSSNDPHAYHVLAMQQKREIMKSNAQQYTENLVKRDISEELVERLLAATTRAVLRTHYPSTGCPVMYTDGFYMLVSQTEKEIPARAMSSGRTIQGQAYEPDASGSGAPVQLLWQLGLALNDYARGDTDTKLLQAQIVALEKAAKDEWQR
jgi:ribonucleotide reductase alpha subunit